jgi:hypothetical protein
MRRLSHAPRKARPDVPCARRNAGARDAGDGPGRGRPRTGACGRCLPLNGLRRAAAPARRLCRGIAPPRGDRGHPVGSGRTDRNHLCRVGRPLPSGDGGPMDGRVGRCRGGGVCRSCRRSAAGARTRHLDLAGPGLRVSAVCVERSERRQAGDRRLGRRPQQHGPAGRAGPGSHRRRRHYHQRPADHAQDELRPRPLHHSQSRPLLRGPS